MEETEAEEYLFLWRIKMPDISGYWDRRADNKDFNPLTERIERGYAARENQAYAAQKRSEKRATRINTQALRRRGLSSSDFFENKIRVCGHHLFFGNYNVAYVDYVNRKSIEINCGTEDYIGKTAAAVSLADLLDEKGIAYSETCPKFKLLEKLTQEKNRIDKILGGR